MTDHKLSPPADYTIGQALGWCLQTAVEKGMGSAEAIIGGVEFAIGFMDIESFIEDPAFFTEAAKRQWFMEEVAQYSGAAMPISLTSPLLVKYPLHSKGMEDLFSQGHGSLRFADTASYLAVIEKEYCDHLFDTLPKVVAASDVNLVKECLGELNRAVVHHPENAQKHLTAERRTLMVSAAEHAGILTDKMRHAFNTAGDTDTQNYDLILRSAKERGLLVNFSKKLH